MKLYREVKCSDRLPDQGFFYAGNYDDQELTSETKHTMQKYCMDYWLEPYELPTVEEIKQLEYNYCNHIPDKQHRLWQRTGFKLGIQAITNLLKGER